MQDWNPALKEWEESVTKNFPSNARILDIGCEFKSIVSFLSKKR